MGMGFFCVRRVVFGCVLPWIFRAFVKCMVKVDVVVRGFVFSLVIDVAGVLLLSILLHDRLVSTLDMAIVA